MNSTLIKNGRLVLENEVIANAGIIIRDGIIEDIVKGTDTKPPAGMDVIDAENCLVGPGFVDVHTHLCALDSFFENPTPVLENLVSHGVTGMLPTIAYNLEKEKSWEILQNLLNLENGLYKKIFMGIHMEGPYLNPKYGSESWKIRKPDKEEYTRYLKTAGDKIKIWVVAPEVEGTNELVEELLKHNIVLSIGHSEAEAELVLALVKKGLKLECHFMCATGLSPSPSRYEGTREAGMDEVVMLSDQVYAEVIPDCLGAHVRPVMLQLLCKVKGAERIIIITDVSPTPGKIHGDVILNQHGQLAGTALTMDKAVKNMITHTGIEYFEAFKMASLNPARLLGIDGEIGSIKKGKRANIAVVDDEINVKKVLIDGERVF